MLPACLFAGLVPLAPLAAAPASDLLATLRAARPAAALLLDPVRAPDGRALAWCEKARGEGGYPQLRIGHPTQGGLQVLAPDPVPLGLAPRFPRFEADGSLSVQVRRDGHGYRVRLDPSHGAILGLAPAEALETPIAPPDPPPPRLLLRGVRVPGLAGAPDLPRADVRLAAGRIVAVSRKALRPEPGEAVRACRGLSLIPGLWDSHVHAVDGLPQELLAAGVTTAVDLGSPWPFEPLAGPGPGTRILWVGWPFDGPTPAWPEAALRLGPDEDPGPAVRYLAGRGAVGCKAYGTLPMAALTRLVAAARTVGLPVLTDLAERTSTILAAGSPAILAHAPDPQGDPAPVAKAVVAAGTAVIPTLGAQRAPAAFFVGRAPTSGCLAGWWDGGGTSRLTRSDTQSMLRRALRSEAFLRAFAGLEGHRILLGTDSGPGVPGLAPGPALVEEAVALAALGYPPRELLEAATARPAQAFGDPDRGLVQPGRIADLVLVEGDPAREVSALARVRAVILGGRIVVERDGP